jgi:hypothetical protein
MSKSTVAELYDVRYMEKYKSFKPTAFDNHVCDDLNDMFVFPLSINRDTADISTLANWQYLQSKIEPEEGEPVSPFRGAEIHRFGHWANGWFELILISPDSPDLAAWDELAAAMADSSEPLDQRTYDDLYLKEQGKVWDLIWKTEYVKEVADTIVERLFDNETLEEEVVVDKIMTCFNIDLSYLSFLPGIDIVRDEVSEKIEDNPTALLMVEGYFFSKAEWEESSEGLRVTGSPDPDDDLLCALVRLLKDPAAPPESVPSLPSPGQLPLLTG